ncbi:alpha-amylase family glycosyl hydrolase [Paenibacillus sp. CMAA1364]
MRTKGKITGTMSRLLLIGMIVSLLSSCLTPNGNSSVGNDAVDQTSQLETSKDKGVTEEVTQPFVNLKTVDMGKSDGVFYEIFVRSFYDSDGNGVGDFNGITQQLDYLVDLGIEGIWLMPINPSPSYHGYDVTDYYDVNADYGSMEDFKVLLDEAHQRGIKVIMDLVVNHSSDKHPWFLESLKSKDNPKRDWYMWAEDQGLDSNTLGAWGQHAWHRSNQDHYLGIFWEGMPDLNLDHPEVREEFAKIGKFWLNLGLDGFRLDAAKHIYEDFQHSVADTQVVKKNQEWWQEFREALEPINHDAYLVGEVWDSAAVVGPYLDKALNSAFNFDLASKIVTSARTEKATDIVSTMVREYDYFSKQSAGQFVDATFLTNHDQNRVMTEMKGNVDHAKMAASILLTFPGNPFIYYGEEIGMLGAKPDERIREPMIWSSDAKGKGQTSWELSLHKENVIPVDEQMEDPNSLFNHYKQLIHWRKQHEVLRDGGILPYKVNNPNIMAYVRALEDKRMLVVHNLSGKAQSIPLDNDLYGSIKEIVSTTTSDAQLAGNQLQLPPYSTVILQ